MLQDAFIIGSKTIKKWLDAGILAKVILETKVIYRNNCCFFYIKDCFLFIN